MKYWCVLSDGASHLSLCETTWVRWIDNLPINSSCPCFINLFFRLRPQGNPLKQNTLCWHKSGHVVVVTFLHIYPGENARFGQETPSVQLPKKYSDPFHPTAATRQRMEVHGDASAPGMELVSVEAFIGAKRICKVLLQTKSSQGKNYNHFILFIPS